MERQIPGPPQTLLGIARENPASASPHDGGAAARGPVSTACGFSVRALAGLWQEAWARGQAWHLLRGPP